MTLRGVIQALVHGSGDAETALADNGYGDLPAEMFGQALSSYADTAPMEEADALSPILTAIDAGDPSDVFAVMEEQPPTIVPESDLSGLGLTGVAGIDAFDDLDAADLDAADLDSSDAAPEDFGVSTADETVETGEAADAIDEAAEFVTEAIGDAPIADVELDDPSAEFVDDAPIDSAGDFAEDLFATAPEVTDDDLSDLDF